MHYQPRAGWGRPAPTLVPWRQGFRLQQGTSVGVGLPKPLEPWILLIIPRGDHTLLRFVTTSDNGVFNGGYLCTSQYFPILILEKNHFHVFSSTLYLFVIV
jgi:hypothetical protein